MSVQKEPECECPGPGFCPRYKREMVKYAWSVCTGKGMPGFPCTPSKSERYKRKWRLALTPDLSPRRTVIPTQPVILPKARPGTELKALLASVGLTPGGCECESRVSQMDAWGPAECLRRRAEIVAWLAEEQKRRGWVATATAAAHSLLSGLAFKLSLTDPLGSLVDEACRRAEEKVDSFDKSDNVQPAT